MRLAEMRASRIGGSEIDERNLKMKQLSVLLVALAVSQLALGGTEVNQQSLGTAQATVDFCAQIKPGEAVRFQQQTGILVSDLSTDELAKLRNTDDYKAAYAATNAALGKVDVQDAAKACDAFLQGG